MMKAHPVASMADEEAKSPWTRPILMIWVIVMFVLLPVEVVKLPGNMTLVDLWTIMALPIVWLSIPRGRQVISFYYMFPMVLILIASFASILVAPAPGNGLTVVLKEIFVFVWFITLAIALVKLDEKDVHRVLVVWSAVALIHGLFIVAQFLFPELWKFTAGYLGRGARYEIYRPSGLFGNANGAAFFQLLAFAPLLLARPSRRTGAVLGLVLLATMMSTGSMGSILSFAAGCAVCVVALALRGHFIVIARMLLRVIAAGTIFGALLVLVISQNERYQLHLQRILLGRAERSSDSRFDLWERGVDVLVQEKVFLWGIGPENFRVVDGNDNQLHNDFMAFTVERGLIGIVGLAMFALLAIFRAIKLFLITHERRDHDAELVVVVLLGAMIAAFVYSLTHQVFHNRQLWMILALQEAMYFRFLKAHVVSTVPAPVAGMLKKRVHGLSDSPVARS